MAKCFDCGDGPCIMNCGPAKTHSPFPIRRRLLEPGDCAYCDKYRGTTMFPSHQASERCESGKRPHCTCDTCF